MATQGLAALGTLERVIRTFRQEYVKTSAKLKVLDTFSALALATALFQFGYCLLVGSFPFNAFLAGFFCSLGAFVLTVSLRMQIEPSDNSGKNESAFADYAIAMCILFLAALNYVG